MVNDRYPSGLPSPDDPGSGFSYGAHDADYGQSAYGTYGTGAHPASPYEGYPTGSAAYGSADPLFGDLPGSDTGTGTYATASWDTGAYPTGAYDTGSYESAAYDTGGYGTAGYDTSGYDTSGHGAGSYGQQADYGYPAPADGTGQWTFGGQENGWGTGSWDMSGQVAAYGYEEHGEYAAHQSPDAYPPQSPQPHQTYQPEQPDQGQAGYETYGAAAYGQDAYGHQDAYGGQAAHTGQFEQFGQDHAYGYSQDATGQWSFTQQHEYDTADTWGFPDPGTGIQQDAGRAPEPDAAATAVFQEIPFQAEAPHDAHDFDAGHGYREGHGYDESHSYHEGQTYDDGHSYGANREHSSGYEPDADTDTDAGYEPQAGGAGYEPDAAPLASVAPHSRGRRRSPKPRRRALMTVAVPSVAVMGVAGAAAASVMGDDDKGSPAPVAAPDAEPVKPSTANSKLDTQLAGLSADADDFADRASRTQERIDLKERQEAERERKAKEAERKEAMRPKYAIPVKDSTLSAQYGQAGVNWMSVHTGIDFPVSYGTPVMAATDGTVTTKYDMSYGNMAIVTAKDGTETWYCHLSSNKIRSGEVKAGDTIAYSGSSGNSTGPHLHFEVRPGGGSAVDPIPWLQGKGLKIS